MDVSTLPAESTTLETLISVGYYLSSIGFLVATILMARVVKGFGKSSLGSIFSYLTYGTGIFFVITIFQKLGEDFFKISDESMDVWWHIMFYMALFFYFYGLKHLVDLGNTDVNPSLEQKAGSEKKWGVLAIITLVIIFIIPSTLEPYIQVYTNSVLASFGLHHFLSFSMAGLVGMYIISARNKLDQISHALATPMIIGILALSIQHFWELLTESWKIIEITHESIEGVEKILLIICAIAICYTALRVKKFANA